MSTVLDDAAAASLLLCEDARSLRPFTYDVQVRSYHVVFLLYLFRLDGSHANFTWYA